MEETMKTLLACLVAAAFLVTAGTASAETAITVGAGWHLFTTAIPGSPPQPPFTYSSATPTLVTLTDLFCVGDQYVVNDGSTTLGETPPSPIPFNCNYPQFTGNPDTALADPNYSHGRFAIPPGAHAIDVIFAGQFGISGGAAIRVDPMTAADCANGAWAAIISPAFASEADCERFASGDSTPPVIAPLGDVLADATTPTGAVIMYSLPTATDPDDAVASLACSPAPGSTFAIGVTTVSCTATDTHGNSATSQFNIHVRGASEQLVDLASAVAGVGPGRSLAAKIAQAQKQLAASDFIAACSLLYAFSNQVSERDERITGAQAADLLTRAGRIRNVLACDGEIAFVRNGDIWVMRKDGSDQTQLTTDPAVDRTPSWSPDGNQIAFASNRDGSFEIYVMNADGSDQHQLTFNLPNSRAPSWTRNGSQIVFDRNFTDSYIVNADGSNAMLLRSNSYLPATSPRSDAVAFSDGVTNALFTMRLDGSQVSQIANPLGQGGIDPNWSTTDRIAFLGAGSATDNDIWAVNADGRHLVQLTNTPDRLEFSPTWSPSGREIAFTGCTNTLTTPDCELYVMRSDGSNVQQLTSTPISSGIHNSSWRALHDHRREGGR
jgi:WD40-like Beta Propeller Repeat/HYR domain